jgi:hypothetical protein
MNKYIVSNNGLGIAVGVTGKTAKEDAILAENIYGVNVSDHLFDSLIYMPSFAMFRKFLILKEYYKVWDAHWAAMPLTKPNIYRFTRHAIRNAKRVIAASVTHENFMQSISCRNNEYSTGSISAESTED